MNFQELMQKMVELDKPKTTNERVWRNPETGEIEGGLKPLKPAAPEANSNDLGNGFEKTETELAGQTVPAIVDTQDGSIITLNKNPQTGGAIFRSPGRYIIIKNGQPKPAFDVGPQTKQALQKAGLAETVEGNEFSGALAKAKASGQKEFEVDGKRYQVTEDDTVEECGMMPGGMSGPMDPPKQQDSVTMNVSMNGSGAGGIRDLLNVLRDIQNGPDDNMPGDDMDMGPEKDMDPSPDMLMKKNIDDMSKMMDDDFVNEPDEMYADMDSVTGTGDDLHSKGKEAPKVNGGGNPMRVMSGETFKLPSGNIKVRLESLYQEIKNR